MLRQLHYQRRWHLHADRAQSLKNNAGVVAQTIAARIKNNKGGLWMSEERQPIPGQKNACPLLRSVFCTRTQQSKRVA